MVNEITIALDTLLWFCGAIAIIATAIGVIVKCFAPFKDLKARVEVLERNSKSDHKELEQVETGVEKICKCTLAIIDHELTGNSIDKLRAAKDEMQDFLIQK